MSLKIKSLRKEISVDISLTSNVKDLKLKIKDQLSISIEKMKLCFDKKDLVNEKILSEYNIKEGSVINLEMEAINIVTNWGPVYVLELIPDFTVTSLKVKIKDLTGINPAYQRLILGAKPLVDGKKLSDYKIVKDSSIYLIERLPGGEN